MRLFAFLILLALPIFAQDAVNLPWWTSPVVQNLGLSQQQMDRIHQIVHSYRNQLLDARNDVTKAEADFDDLLSDPQVTSAMAKPVIDRLANNRATVTRVFTTMSVELRCVLTPEQWRQLEKRWAEVKKTRQGNGARIQP